MRDVYIKLLILYILVSSAEELLSQSNQIDYRIEQKMALIKNILNNPEQADSIVKCSEFYMEGITRLVIPENKTEYFKYFEKMNYCFYISDLDFEYLGRSKYRNNLPFENYLNRYIDSINVKKKYITYNKLIYECFTIYPDYSDTSLYWYDKINVKFVYFDRIEKWVLRHISNESATIIFSNKSNYERFISKAYTEDHNVTYKPLKNNKYKIEAIDSANTTNFINKYNFINELLHTKDDVYEKIINSNYYDKNITQFDSIEDSSFTFFKSFIKDTSKSKILSKYLPFEIDEYRTRDSVIKTPDEEYWLVKYLESPSNNTSQYFLEPQINSFQMKFIYINNKWLLHAISKNKKHYYMTLDYN